MLCSIDDREVREIYIRREMLMHALRTMINNPFKVFQKNNPFKESFYYKRKKINVLITFFHFP